jgi:hypothetical protein
MFRRFGFRRVCGGDVAPLRFLRRSCGADGLALDDGPLVVICDASAFISWSFTRLGSALSPGALPTATSMPSDSNSTVMPLPWPTYYTACAADPAAGSKVMGREKFAGTE